MKTFKLELNPAELALVALALVGLRRDRPPMVNRDEMNSLNLKVSKALAEAREAQDANGASR